MFDYRDFIRSHRVLLAPLAGVSDIAFRQVCIECGAELAFTEMVSAKGLSYANERTVHLMEMARGEDRVGVQIFGHEPAIMASQAAWIEDRLGENLAVIDINMGCPARKIVSKGDGAALMKDLDLAQRIISEVVNAVDVAVSVKMRRAYDKGPDRACELALRAEDAGVAAVTVHGRYATQMYRGGSDWSVIRAVKDALCIPVIGNGDIQCASDAIAMMELTGCDSVMVARGARGNPWIFADIRRAIDDFPECSADDIPISAHPAPRERMEMARRQTRILHECDPRSVVRMRKHASWYARGLPGASQARAAFNECCTYDNFCMVYDQLISHVEEFEAIVTSPVEGEGPSGENAPCHLLDGGK